MLNHKQTCRLSPVACRYFLRTCCLLLVACCCLRANAAGNSSPINVLNSFLDGLKTYSAGFKQQVFDDSGKELEKSDGVFYMRRPGMFYWAYYEPYSQMFISDGLNLWIYDQDLDQVIIKDVSNQLGNSPAAILGGNVDISHLYVVNRMQTKDGLDWLELTPRNIESEYKTIRLGFKDGQLAQMVLFDNLGQKNMITFLDAKRNPPLNLKLFSFVPPKGVDVIDDRR